MPTQSFIVKYEKNSQLLFSPQELKDSYFFGIPLEDSNGNTISDETIKFYIRSAQKQMEDYLQVKLFKQVYEESKDFVFDNWIQWGYIPTTYPANQAFKLQGFLNTTLQVDYPEDWLSTKKESDNVLYHRTVNLVPVQGSANSLSNNVIYTGIAPYIGYFGNKQIPNYWEISYITGWDQVPADILNAVGKFAAINVFHVLGDIIIGAGVAGKTISIDGLSQSVRTTASATTSGYSGRISGYLRDLETTLPILKAQYKGIVFSAL